jgi:hypothetical protein
MVVPSRAVHGTAQKGRGQASLLPLRRGGREPEADRPGIGAWLAVVVVAAGVALRFWTTSHLWLDEALTVNIARLPVGRIPDALRHDGSPPLYYLALHVWMRIFGSGDAAVRALSGLFGVGTLAALPFAARATGARRGWAALVLAAVSPFAVRYATEARMYSLLMLLVTLGVIALARLLRSPSVASAAAVGLVTGLALLTHYWSVFLAGVVAVWLLAVWLRHRERAALWGLAAMAAGGLLFLPWAPVFVFQLGRTGTPWASPATIGAPLSSVFEWAGGYRDSGQLLALVLLALAALGLFGAAVDHRRIELDLRTRPEGRALALGVAGTLALALVACAATRSAFVQRYTSVVFPLFLLLAAAGAETLLSRRVRHGILGVAVVLSLAGGLPNTGTGRTQAGVVARAINATASPGDVVAFCPDQLAPSVSRLLHVGLVEITFPLGAGPQRIDWVDYAARNAAASSAAFTQMLVSRAGAHNIWLVWSGGYRTLGTKCGDLRRLLQTERPEGKTVVTGSGRYEEHMGLVRYPTS